MSYFRPRRHTSVQTLVSDHKNCYHKESCAVCLLIEEAEAAHRDAAKYEGLLNPRMGAVDGNEEGASLLSWPQHEGHQG